VELEVVGFRVGAPLGAACSCYSVRARNTSVLLDLGPGALERLWKGGTLGGLDAIVISHMHMDHVLDVLPLSSEITQTALRQRYPNRPPPQLYVPADGGISALDALARAVGSTFDRFSTSFEIREYDERDHLKIGALALAFARMTHPRPCYAARVGDGVSTIVYGADGSYSESLVSHAAGADLALLEATYVDLEAEAERHGHMTAEQAGLVADRAGVARLLLTHVGPWEAHNAETLRLARARFAGDVELVREGGVYTTR
jgi:ribonuclease BN (tRNA processing enzyme)